MDEPVAMLPVRIPRGPVDGAIVELAQDKETGVVTAEIHIPGHQQQSAIDAYQEASNEIRYLTGD